MAVLRTAYTRGKTDLVHCGQACPRLVCPPVIVLSFCHFHVVTEADQNLGLPQLLHCGPLAELGRGGVIRGRSH